MPWIKITFVLCVAGWFQKAFSAAGDTFEEMEWAFNEDIPAHAMPTRSQFEAIPLVGRLFKLSCDAGDVLRTNMHFLREYITLIPWLAATPALVTSVPLLAAPVVKGITAGRAAMLALTPIMSGIR